MKILFTMLLACPNFSGLFLDEAGVQVQFNQVQCDRMTMSSDGESTLLQLDGISRPHETGSTEDSFLASKFDGQVLKIENLIRPKGTTDGSYRYKMRMSYEFESPDVLKENTELLDSQDKVLDQKESRLTRTRATASSLW